MELNNEIKNIIKNSTFQIIEGVFVYTKVNKIPETSGHFMITVDKDEITVVTESGKLNELDIIERNKDDYSLIALNVSIPFYSVGFLSAVNEAIAKGGMNILIVSTYSKDYIMVKEDQTGKAKETLLSLGFQEKF
jgi:hypothetical protein